jgi:hypothetical protein
MVEVKIEMHSPQLDTLINKIDERNARFDRVLDILESVGVLALDRKLAASQSTTTAPDPVQPPLPLTYTTPSDKPKTKRSSRATEAVKPAPRAPEAVNGNGEAHDDHDDRADDDENTLRARVTFEGKRVSRTFGVGGMRAAIRKITGENILQIDDVPLQALPALLAELQAM